MCASDLLDGLSSTRQLFSNIIRRRNDLSKPRSSSQGLWDQEKATHSTEPSIKVRTESQSSTKKFKDVDVRIIRNDTSDELLARSFKKVPRQQSRLDKTE